MLAQTEIYIILIWLIPFAISTAYSFNLISDISFNGSSNDAFINWSFDYLDPEYRSLIYFLREIIILLIIYFFVGHMFRDCRWPYFIISGIAFGILMSQFGFLLYLFCICLNYGIHLVLKTHKYYHEFVWIINLIIISIIYSLNGFQDQIGVGILGRIPFQTYYVWGVLKMISYHFEFQESNILEYLGYVLYAPLLYSGPLIPFQEFKKQVINQQKPVLFYQFMIVAIILYIYSYLTIPYSLSNHIGNLWIWDRKLNQINGICYLICSIIYVWLKFVFIWTAQSAWAHVDGIYPPDNCPNHLFRIYSAKTFGMNFCSSLKNFIDLYLVYKYRSQLIYPLVYSVLIILFNADQFTIWIFVLLCIFNMMEDKYGEQRQAVLYFSRMIGQMAILMVLSFYTSNFDIIKSLVGKGVIWFGILVAFSGGSQLFIK